MDVFNQFNEIQGSKKDTALITVVCYEVVDRNDNSGGRSSIIYRHHLTWLTR